MRNELEIIEKIERYLTGQLSAADRAAFEQQIAADADLREALRLQQDIMMATQRTSARQSIQRARQHYLRARHLARWGGFGLGLGLVIVLLVVIYHHSIVNRPNTAASQSVTTVNGQPAPASPGATDSSLQQGHLSREAGSNLPTKIFWLNPVRDTVIETKGGIILSISAGAFLDAHGLPVKNRIELLVREALDPAAILRSGLSTRAGDALLETGGMFAIDAQLNGQPLTIDPAHAIIADVPTDSVRPGMQLFSGQRLPDGSIDWVNPKPLDHDLVTVDIGSLDFYPPHYLDSLRRWGYNSNNKTFTDSLYYSFARFFSDRKDEMKIGTAEVAAPEQQAPISDTTITQRQHIADATKTKMDTSFPLPKLNSAVYSLPCGVNPAKIKTIWSSRFQHTVIATREFQQRLVWIHRSGENGLLDLYIDHLDMDLSAIDSMAAQRLTGSLRAQFLAFAARRDGKVRMNVRQLDKLRDYYQQKVTAFTEATASILDSFWRQQTALDEIADDKRRQYEADSLNRTIRNFREEFLVTLRSVDLQLGLDTAIGYIPLPTAVYRAEITISGWQNIDRIVAQAVNTRQTTGITHGTAQAIIRYDPVTIHIEEPQLYDLINVYLLPDKLSSFMQLKASGDNYTEQLNDLMTYRLVCIAYKDGQAYFYSLDRIKPGQFQIQLTAINNRDLDKKLNDMGSRTQATALQTENGYFRFDIRDQKRQRHNRALQELTDRIMAVIFPCVLYNYNTTSPVSRMLIPHSPVKIH